MSRTTERIQTTGEGRARDGKRQQRLRGQEWQETRIKTQSRSPRGPWVESNGSGDTREGKKEEVRGKGGEWEPPSPRLGSQNTEVGGDGATRPKRGHSREQEAHGCGSEMGVQRTGGAGAADRAPESNGRRRIRPDWSIWPGHSLGLRTPASPPTPLPAGPCAPACWPP